MWTDPWCVWDCHFVIHALENAVLNQPAFHWTTAGFEHWWLGTWIDICTRFFWDDQLAWTLSTHTEVFYTQKPLHKEAFTHRGFYTETHLHRETFTHRNLHTRKLFAHATFLHTDASTQTRLQTDAFSHGSFYIHTLNRTTQILRKNISFWHLSFISCKKGGFLVLPGRHRPWP